MEKRVIQIKNYIKNLDPKKLGLNQANNILIKEINRGGYNINYLVNFDNHKFLFRLNLDKYIDVDNQIEYEYQVLKYLEGKDIGPRPYFIDTSKEDLEHDLLVEEFIKNKPLKFGSKFLKDLGKLVRKLHLVPLPKNDFLIKNSNPLVDQWNFIKKKIDFIESTKFNQKFLSFIDPYIPKIDRYVFSHSELFPTKEICINHRDMVIENVLQTNKGLRFIDWQAAMIDDPSYDLTLFFCDIMIEWNLGRGLTDKEKQIFLDGYQGGGSLSKKIDIRQPMTYLELFIWIAYRTSYLYDKLEKNLVKDFDKEFFQKRVLAYENFLDEKRIKKYLKVFK